MGNDIRILPCDVPLKHRVNLGKRLAEACDSNGLAGATIRLGGFYLRDGDSFDLCVRYRKNGEVGFVYVEE